MPGLRSFHGACYLFDMIDGGFHGTDWNARRNPPFPVKRGLCGRRSFLRVSGEVFAAFSRSLCVLPLQNGRAGELPPVPLLGIMLDHLERLTADRSRLRSAASGLQKGVDRVLAEAVGDNLHPVLGGEFL